MPKVTVLATPDLLKDRDLTGWAAAVIDVLRATSSIATAMTSGCVKLIPARDKQEAVAMRSRYPGALLTGEEGGLKIPGFDLGNSPREYSPERVRGKTIIMTTSNGTRAVLGASSAGASPIFLCSFLNLPAAARACSSTGLDLAVVCSGSHGEFSLEDFACAGALCATLASLGPYELDSGARAAACLFEAYSGDALQVMRDSPHGRQLIGLGFGEDLVYCSRIGALNAVPSFSRGAITLDKTQDKPQQR